MQKNTSKNAQKSAPKTHSESHKAAPTQTFNHSGANFVYPPMFLPEYTHSKGAKICALLDILVPRK